MLKRSEDGEDREHRVAAHKGVAMLEVGLDGGDEWLQDLRLLELAQEAQGAAADVPKGKGWGESGDRGERGWGKSCKVEVRRKS